MMLSHINGSDPDAFESFSIWGLGGIRTLAEIIDKFISASDGEPNEAFILAYEIMNKTEELERHLYRLLEEYNEHHGIQKAGEVQHETERS